MKNSTDPTTDSYFRIADLEFEVESAVLAARWMKDTMGWSIAVRTIPKVVEGEEWRPSVSSDWLYGMEGKACDKWTDLFPRVLEWESGFNHKDDRIEAWFYVFECVEIKNARLEFGVPKGNWIPLRWTGRANVFFDEKYGENLDLEVQADCLFEGVEIGKLGEMISMEEALRRARATFRTQDFEFKPPTDRHEYPMLLPVG